MKEKIIEPAEKVIFFFDEFIQFDFEAATRKKDPDPEVQLLLRLAVTILDFSNRLRFRNAGRPNVTQRSAAASPLRPTNGW